MTVLLSPADVLEPAPDVVARRLGTAVVLVHLGTNRIFELNETGARVWELISQRLSVEEIIRTLVHEYEVEVPDAEAKVALLVEDLRTTGLLA